jgi:hypothetical protein
MEAAGTRSSQANPGVHPFSTLSRLAEASKRYRTQYASSFSRDNFLHGEKAPLEVASSSVTAFPGNEGTGPASKIAGKTLLTPW